MSNYSVHDLQSIYPFLWDNFDTPATGEVGVVPQALQNIKDLRVIVVLPSDFQVPDNAEYIAYLRSISSTNAVVAFSWGAYTNTINIPVYTVENADITGSYVLAKTVIPWTDSEMPGVVKHCYINPACILILQEPPKISVQETVEYHSDRTRISRIVELEDTIAIESGYNVAALVNSNDTTAYITFNCGSENGKGVWISSPWSDKDITQEDIVGLLSINGITGDVSIIGDASVEVTTTQEAVGQENEVTLTIGVKQ